MTCIIMERYYKIREEQNSGTEREEQRKKSKVVLKERSGSSSK